MEDVKLSLPPKMAKKLVWIPVISFCKIFILSYVFDGMLCRNWPFLPPSRVTSWITLLLTTSSTRRAFTSLLLSHELDRIHQLGCCFASDQFCGGFSIDLWLPVPSLPAI